MNENITMADLHAARANADHMYDEWVERTGGEEDAWAVLGYGLSADKPGFERITSLIKDNWGKISAVAAAFGVPLAAADVGAFTGILGKFASLWPF